MDDAGIGIPRDDLEQLFRRFRRPHNARAYPGSRLSLAFVKAGAEGHGGSVLAETTPAARVSL